MLKAIDISHWNNDRGPIDWQGLRDDGYTMALIKITEGTTFKDPRRFENVQNAKKHGFVTVGYHYAHWNTVDEARKEAAFFKSVCANLQLQGAAADVEHNDEAKGDLSGPTNAFIDEVKDMGPALVYSYPFFIKKHFAQQVTHQNLWIAHYGVSNPRIAPWADWVIWQYSSTAHMDEIAGNVDVNHVKESFFEKYGQNPKKSKPSHAKKRVHVESLLQVGDRGTKVKELQTHLTVFGCEPGPIDGDFGPKTEKGVKRMQERHSLKQDGIVGPNTRGAIEKELDYPGHIYKADQPYPHEDKVGNVQRLMNLLHYDLKADGIYGPKTAASVRDFQQNQEIKVDGITGPQTWSHMFGD